MPKKITAGLVHDTFGSPDKGEPSKPDPSSPDQSIPDVTRQNQATPRLWVSWLRVENFRNYQAAELVCDDKPVILYGTNGAGKTNILEAVSLLSPGRGLRGARLADLILQGSEIKEESAKERQSTPLDPFAPLTWSVVSDVQTSGGTRRIGTTLQRGDGQVRERRLVKIDGEQATSQQDLASVASVVWLTPQMDRLFQEGPGARRRFLDRLVYAYDSGHAARVSGYEQLLRERVKVLKMGGDTAWLTSLESSLAQVGTAIATARRELVTRLSYVMQERETLFPQAILGMLGEVEAWLEKQSASETEDLFAGRLFEERGRDREVGGAGTGVHRSDLHAIFDDRGGTTRMRPAHLCSTGEQKALLVSIVLAHVQLLARTGHPLPLVLLDEVAAHFDEKRRAALLQELEFLGIQAWMTGTDSDIFDVLGTKAQRFAVSKGTISRAPS